VNASLRASHPAVTNPAVLSREPIAAEGGSALLGAAADGRSAANGHSAALSAWLGPNGAQWAGRAAEFNRYPARYAHPSWIPEGWAPWLPRFAGRGRAEAELGRGLLKAWGLDGRPCFDFAPPARRFALLDAAPLRRAVLLAGLARHAGEISLLMERGRVLELKEQVGEAGYRFVMLRAPLLAGPLAEGAGTAAEGADWLTRSWAAGLGMLGACLGAEHAGLLARVSVKFPRDCAPFLSAGGGQGTADAYMRLFRRVLVKEVDPAWDVLFS
jgi:hypothetical protein